jgi:tetratricopeptide (TPR) repeat protein
MAAHSDPDDIHYEDDGPDEIELLCRNALINLDDGDLDEARSIAMQAVELDADHPFPVFVLGLIADQEGDIAVARYLSERALQNAGTNADAIQFRAQIHLREHEFERAEDLLRFGVAHNPDDADLQEHLARVLLAMGHYEDAARSAQAALELDPNSSGAHAVRVAALDESGDAEALLGALRQNVQMHPDDPYAALHLASIESENGNVSRARLLLARAQRLAPRDESVLTTRRVLEAMHASPLLRGVLPMTRWLKEFPGGLAGFVLAYLLVSMPLGALAGVEPAYAIPARALLVAWGAAAIYAFVGPTVLNCRLNRIAVGPTRTALEQRDPDLELVIDAAIGCIAGKQFGAAIRTLELRCDDFGAEDQEMIRERIRDMHGMRYRFLRIFGRIPGDVRFLIATGVVLGVHSSMLAKWTELPVNAFLGATFACLSIAWLLAHIDMGFRRRIAEMSRVGIV